MMRDRQIAVASIAIAILALIVSTAAYLQSRAQFQADYEEDVTVKADQWPINPISSTELSELKFEVRNTSKQNLEYFLRLAGNATCVSESKTFDIFKPCQHESRPIRLSKPEAGSHYHLHTLYIKALPGAVKMNPLAYASDPNYSVTLEIVSARNGKILHQKTCYYTYIPDSQSLSLYQPIIDTSGESKSLLARCM